MSELPQDAALFDVFLREGFGSVAEGLEQRLREAGGGEVRSYRLAESLASLLPGTGRAPFVVFADACLDAGESHLRRLARLLRHNPGIPALTFGGEALTRVYGEPADPGGGHVSQRLAPVRHLPSWFCAVNRELLVEDGFHTPEFLLLDLGRRLAERSVQPLSLASAPADLDTRFWARDLLFQAPSHLAADYSRWRSLHGADGVPPQLRVEIRGEVVPPPGRLEPEELAAGGPKISLLCPVFKPRFLADMLRSVLQQTWSNWELLILVDGPPEEDERQILEILSRVRSEPRIRCRRGQNRGTGPCRQSLAEEATGDFLLPIDDDDLLPAHALEVFASAVRKHPEARCFRGGMQLVGLVEEYLRPRRRLVVAGISGDPFEVSQPFLVARETLAEVGGFEGDPALRNAGEDTWLFHKLDRAGVRTLILDEPLYLRRLSQENLSLDFNHEEVLGHFRNLERRFCPSGWASAGRHNELAGGYQQSIVTWRRQESEQEVVTATRFFQYKTLGDESLAAIDLELTSVCNAVCTFCPRELMPDTKSFLPLDVVQALASQLAQEPKQRQVVLCGIGESTLHPELATIIRLLSQAGARVCMTTNGSRLDAELFQRWIDCGLKELNVSLNAATPETHFRVMRLRRFAQIKEGLLQALDLKHRRYPHIRVHVSFVLCSLNQDEVHAFVDEWRPTPVTQIWLHPINNRAGLLSPEARAVDLEPLARRYAGDSRVVVDIFKHHPEDGHLCKIARSMDFISVDGRLRLCAMDYERKTDYGDVRHDRLRHLYLEKILSHRRGETLSLCQGCDFHPGRAAAAPQETTVGLADVRP